MSRCPVLAGALLTVLALAAACAGGERQRSSPVATTAPSAVVAPVTTLPPGPPTTTSPMDPPTTGPVTTVTPVDPVRRCDATRLGERCWWEIDHGGDGPAPLVVDLHGYNENGRWQWASSGMDGVARRVGAVVVYPDSPDGSWNGGVCCGAATVAARDDAGAVMDIVDLVLADGHVDPAAILVTGFSNGCALTQGIIDRFADRVRAGACLAHYWTLTPVDDPVPVPFLQIHGTEDRAVPYGGADLNLGRWAERNGCTGRDETVVGDVTTVALTGCAAPVVHMRVDGRGHVGSYDDLNGRSSAEVIWHFFAAA